MTHRVTTGIVRVAFAVALGAALSTGCGDDDATGASDTYCCVLRKLADHCNTGSSSSSLRKSVQAWRTLGDSHNGDACKIVLDSEEVGCSSSSATYDEESAAVECVELTRPGAPPP